jgi:hypothetical protein
MSGCVVGKCSRTVLVLLLTTGCATNGSDRGVGDGGAGYAGSAAVDPSPEPACLTGASCSCGNGETGALRCGQATSSCDCAACPPFEPTTRTAFKACGGAPEGTWLTRSYDLSGVVAHFAVALLGASESITCPADFSELAAPDLRLVLNLSGSAEIAYTAPDLYGTVLESCIQAELGRSCEQFPQCNDTGCGTCGCGFAKSDLASAAERWDQNEATLTVGPLTFDYCVKDEAMTLVNRADGVMFELERVVVPEPKCSGTPAECGINETEQDCRLVRGCGAQTACVGDAVRTCDYLVDVCTLCPAGCDCQFDVGQSQCAGVAHCQDMQTNADCAGLGCAWQGFVGCGGTPVPCDSLTVAECRFTPGCNVK